MKKIISLVVSFLILFSFVPTANASQKALQVTNRKMAIYKHNGVYTGWCIYRMVF